MDTEHVEHVEHEETHEKKQKKPSTEKQLEQKRKALDKARAVRSNKLKEKKDIVEKIPEPVVVEHKPAKKKKQVIREVVKEEHETDSEDTEEEVVERVIVKKVPRPKKEPSKNDMVNLTYREKLQQQLKDEKMRMIMSSLFDY